LAVIWPFGGFRKSETPIIMKLVQLLWPIAAVLAASSCDNPLFSVANWPTDLTRPRYLASPQTSTNTTFCAKAQSGSAQSCCDSATIADILTLFKDRRGAMQQKGEKLEGGVRDTFNDFDPENQQSSGVSTGGGRMLQGPGKNNTAPTGNQGQNNPGPTGNQGKNNTGTMGPPPKEDRPDGFNNADVPQANMTNAEPPKGRGKEKNRPGILKMSEAGKQSIGNITRTMNALMKQFAHNMGKCMKGHLNHLAGMLCMGCDPDWETWVNAAGTAVTVQISNAACDRLTEDCLDFVKQSQSLPALIESMKASIQAVITSEIAAGTITQADVPTDDLSSQTKPPAQVTAVCSTDDACRTYICEVMSKGKGVAPEPATVADPATVSSTGGRMLAASVTYQVSSSGYDSVSQGTTATASTAETSTFNIDGVSTEVSPLVTDSAVYLMAGLLTLVF